MGDGTVIEQRAGDAGFGKLDYRYASHGVYVVTLTVTDSADNPCNTATATRSVTVNAPPVANAGGNRSTTPGALTFDAGADAMPTAISCTSGGISVTAGGRCEGVAWLRQTRHLGRPLAVDDGKGAPNSVAVGHARIFVNAGPEGGVRIPDRLVVGMPGPFDASRAVDIDGKIVETAWSFGDGTTSAKAVTEAFLRQAGHLRVTLSSRQFRPRQCDDDDCPQGRCRATRTSAGGRCRRRPRGRGRCGGGLRWRKVARRGRLDPLLSLGFGDGAGADGIEAKHAYRMAGTYHATLTVTDDSGRENSTASTSST